MKPLVFGVWSPLDGSFLNVIWPRLWILHLSLPFSPVVGSTGSCVWILGLPPVLALWQAGDPSGGGASLKEVNYCRWSLRSIVWPCFLSGLCFLIYPHVNQQFHVAVARSHHREEQYPPPNCELKQILSHSRTASRRARGHSDETRNMSPSHWPSLGTHPSVALMISTRGSGPSPSVTLLWPPTLTLNILSHIYDLQPWPRATLHPLLSRVEVPPFISDSREWLIHTSPPARQISFLGSLSLDAFLCPYFYVKSKVK